MRNRQIGTALIHVILLTMSGASAAGPAWQLLDDGDPGANTATLVYDSQRQRVVALHTVGSIVSATTWELVGSDWVRRFQLGQTAADIGCAAYDAARNQTVAIGGEVAGTWVYNGSTWQQRFPSQQPPDRVWCQMVYDSIRQRVVLFGGYRFGFGSLQDTWEWDGTNWTNVVTANKPARRGHHGMTYDAGRGVVVLHGGQQDSALPLNDTWEYNGTNWIAKSTNLPQPLRGRWGIELCYFPPTGKTILFGGTNSVQAFNDTWEWNGTAWTQRVTTNAPSPRWHFRIAYATDRQRIIGWGGQISNSAVDDTWEFNGTTWSLIPKATRPAGRADHGMAFDETASRLVIMGGSTGLAGPPHSDTWLWSVIAGWVRDTTAGVPSAVKAYPLAYESAHDRVVGFSGTNSMFQRTEEIHEYSGVPRIWTDSTAVPDKRFHHGWVSAPGLGGMFLFGGYAQSPTGLTYFSSETWLLTGAGWEQRFPEHAPPQREVYAMTYDSTRNQVLLYGGEPISDDFWVYDGNDWRLIDTTPPGERRYSSMAFDPIRSRAVLYGGGPDIEGVTWEFDGSSWHTEPTPLQPESYRQSFTMNYSAAHDVVFLFGGIGGEVFNDLWAYGDDPDGDGFVGGLDNCRQTPNATQLNADGDAAGDLCDCSINDPAVFNIPGVVVGSLFLPDKQTLQWNSLSASAGSGTHYDVLRGRAGEWPVGSGPSETCIGQNLASTALLDAFTPGSGSAFWYLVRGRNNCGMGSYGAASNGTTRVSSSCP